MNFFLILVIVGLIFIFLGYSNQLKQYATVKQDNSTSTTTIKYVPRTVYDDMVMTNLI